jgi:hypothetical protein
VIGVQELFEAVEQDGDGNDTGSACRSRGSFAGRRCALEFLSACAPCPKSMPMVASFGLRVRPVELEIPSTSLRAGSSLRLKNGCAQDDAEFGLEVRTQAHQTHTVGTPFRGGVYYAFLFLYRSSTALVLRIVTEWPVTSARCTFEV